MKLLVLDGNSILNRAYYGIKLLTTKNGEYTNAVYGFLNTMHKTIADTSPDAVAVAFDRREPTFRHKEYNGYKASRHGMPDELAQQLPVVKELLEKLGYTLVECAGYEADDILGTLAKACEDSGNICVLATGDRDSLQLVSGATNVRLITTKSVVTYDEAKIKEEYGVTPHQLIDIKAIQGDTSDNIPGVKGIGQKGASELIEKYGSLDYIYDNIDSLELKPAMYKKLTEGKESAYLSRYLGEIVKDAPVDTELEHYIPKEPQYQEALSIMTRLELFTLINKFGLNNGTVSPVVKEDIDIVQFNLVSNTDANLEEIITDRVVSVLYTGKNTLVSNGINIAVSNDCGVLYRLFSNSNKKITHGIKGIFALLDEKSIEPQGEIFDAELAAYLLNPSASSYDIDRLAQEYNAPDFLVKNADDSELKNDINALAQLAVVSENIESEIEKNNQRELLHNIEIPLANVLACMENRGFMADRNGIERFGSSLGGRIDEIKQEIYNLVGYEFNINSPKQLGTALFEKLGLPPLKKTKSGYSTGAEVLEKLADEHPAVAYIMEYRQLSKLKSTYCDGLLKVIDKTGRIHSSFNQTETRTGRISSTEPNLQNIPVRTELGKEMRRFFTAADGCVLVDADYSQIELRVLAHIANDKEMCNAFINNYDIHTITASQVFGMPVEMVTPLMRSRAKAVNFGIVYGIGAFSLSKDIGVSIKEADRYIKAYLAHYSGVDEYMKNIIEQAKETGYVETMFNRRRYLPELSASNKMVRSFGERVARNMPIQGTAADIIKIAMIRVHNRLRTENMRTKLILQVHDELIVEAPIDEAEKAAALLQEEMENAVHLSVPLIADAAIGKTWYDAKG